MHTGSSASLTPAAKGSCARNCEIFPGPRPSKRLRAVRSSSSFSHRKMATLFVPLSLYDFQAELMLFEDCNTSIRSLQLMRSASQSQDSRESKTWYKASQGNLEREPDTLARVREDPLAACFRIARFLMAICRLVVLWLYLLAHNQTNELWLIKCVGSISSASREKQEKALTGHLNRTLNRQMRLSNTPPTVISPKLHKDLPTGSLLQR